MMIRVSIDVDMKISEKLQENLSSLRGALDGVGALLQASVLRNFEAQGRPKWANLSKRTLKRKKEGDLILHETGLLKQGIAWRFEDPDTIVIGPSTAKSYAAIHQFGGRAGKNHAAVIPARPYLAIQDEDFIEIEKAIFAWIHRGLS